MVAVWPLVITCQRKKCTVESRFLKPSIFRTSQYLEPNVISPPQLNTVILPLISQTLQFYEPIFVSLGGSKNQDSTVVVTVFPVKPWTCSFSILAYVSENSRYERYFTESDVESSRHDQTQLDSASEGKKNEPITSDIERRLFHMQSKGHISGLWLVIFDPYFL